MGNTCSCDTNPENTETILSLREEVEEKSQTTYIKKSKKKTSKKDKNRKPKRNPSTKQSSTKSIAFTETSEKYTTVTTDAILDTEKNKETFEGVFDIQELDEEDDLPNLKPSLKDTNGDTENLNLLKQAGEKVEEVYAWKEDIDWTLFKDKSSVAMYTSPTTKGAVLCYHKAHVNASTNTCLDTLNDYENHFKANGQIGELRTIEQIDSPTYDAKYVYRRIKGNLVVSSRDFVYMNAIFPSRKLNDSSSGNAKYYIISYSQDHEDAPKTKGIRGTLDNLWVLTEISENETEIEAFFHLNLKGSLPKILFGLIKSKMWEEMRNFKNLMEA